MDEINKVWSHWKTEEVIGQGGFGTVYKVKRETFDKVSYGAVKVIKIPSNQAEVDEMTTSGLNEASIKNYYKDMVYQLLDEIKMMENLKSASHVVNIEDYEIIENKDSIGWTIFIRMELLTNLPKYMKEHPLTQNDVATLGVQICKALEYCQQNNIIHRDIKPGNIFVTNFGEYKLGDFGISREIEQTNATLSQKGTKSYMAPEMIRMEKYGKSVDTYALGLTMYEILNYGRIPFLPAYPEPFYPKDREEAMLKRLTGETFPPASLADEKMNYILCKACDANIKERYQTATEMKADLEAYLQGNTLPSQQGIVETVVPAFVSSKEEIIIENDTVLSEEETVIGTETIFDQINSEEKTVIGTSELFEELNNEEVIEETKTDYDQSNEEERTVGMFSTKTFMQEVNEDDTIDDELSKNQEEDIKSDVEQEDSLEINVCSQETDIPEKKNNKMGIIIAVLLLLGIGVGAVALGGSKNETPSNNDVVDTDSTEDIYNNLVGLMNNASTKEDYQNVLESFTEISDYKDVKDLMEQCRNKIADLEKTNDEDSTSTNDSTTTNTNTSTNNSNSNSNTTNTNTSTNNTNSNSNTTTPVVKNWSDYTTSLPSNITSDKYYIEEQIRYSYRDKETTRTTDSALSGWTLINSETGYTEWSAWSEWGECTFNDARTYSVKNALSKTENYETKTEGVRGREKNYYRYRTREEVTYYNYNRWSEWSSYSTTQVAGSDTREVRTQTYYRYKEK